ncbi:hypothetical protein [Pseudonocardia sp. WMMC193]|uniref:hypothetical protein n=1 Tax=Pseudonocardia sp. WMMC193 TaxID=2911965 RepID=UPI001F2DB3A0|nr:hypothetical protein [Pseudonocardia sp. WMMC193]MCF7550735.1 hypothetical protein [Pseudonocardia sp. WMMC193]
MTSSDARNAPHATGPIDGPAAVRAASAGFTVLLLGGLAAPIAAQFLPVVGQFWLSIVAVAAFVVAGWRIGDARNAALHGACAALGSYVLVLPLVLWTAGLAAVGWGQIVGTAAVAVVVGGLTGFVVGRRRDSGG